MSHVQCEQLIGAENERTMNWCDLERSDMALVVSGDAREPVMGAPLVLEGEDEA